MDMVIFYFLKSDAHTTQGCVREEKDGGAWRRLWNFNFPLQNMDTLKSTDYS